MAEIDVGAAAVNRSSTAAGGLTYIGTDNPANDTGTLDTFQIWANTNMANVECATFYVVSGTNFSTRASASIGSVTSGSLQTFTGLSIAVSAGDYLGIQWPSLAENIERNTSGFAGIWYKSGDYIPCTNQTFTALAGDAISIYAVGATPGFIDIGAGAIDRADLFGETYTFVDKANPANATGTLDTVKVYAGISLVGFEIATFYVVSGNNLSTRGNATIGAVTAGSTQTFTGLSVAVTVGDYLGGYFSDGDIDWVNGTTGFGGWYTWNVDNIPCTNTAFDALTATQGPFSIYATGTTGGGGGVVRHLKMGSMRPWSRRARVFSSLGLNSG